MSMLADFFHKRNRAAMQPFNAIGEASNRTVMVSSHIWWTDLMAFALLKLGYNVVLAPPWYSIWGSDENFRRFDLLYADIIANIRKYNVKLLIGGNTTAMLPHHQTRVPVHTAAGIPAVHYWWDAPRVMPEMLAKRGLTLRDYIGALRDAHTLNCIWDIDVMEELGKFLGITNTAHLPLAATPEMWETTNVPLADRPVKVSFLGTGHPVTDEQKAEWDPALREWAEQTVAAKLADRDRPMVDCVARVKAVPRAAGETPDADAMYRREFARWAIVDAMLAERVRTRTVLAVAEMLGPELELIGTGWESMGLKPVKDHSGVPDAKKHYVAAKASLNLFGGSVHGGLPLRPYEIASSNGLIFTAYQRELPSLYEPGKECVAFKNVEEMQEQLDRILTHPSDYDAVVTGGRDRTIAEHTWEHRMKRLIDLATERFGISW
jgi:hypothetical protein